MKKILLSIYFLIFCCILNAQLIPVENSYQNSFTEAYTLYPDIPLGSLEAISYQQTRMSHLTADMDPSCTGMPQYLGVMGLIENGKNYFNENFKKIALISGKDINILKQDPHEEILAFAYSWNQYIQNNPTFPSTIEEKLFLLEELTEIPLQLNLPGNSYAFDAYLYGIIQFMTDPNMQLYYGFPDPKIKGEIMFGERWKFMSSQHIYIHEDHIENEDQESYMYPNSDIVSKSADYAPALWNPAATCNYSGRGGVPVTAVTIHDVEGSYAGCISYFQNCAAQVSAHYVMRSSDGQVTQMVLESNKAWHVGSENNYTVGIEHEGFNNNPAWWTTAMYNSSSALVIDIANSYGINKIRTGWWPWLASTEYSDYGIPGACVRIKGHEHFPNQTHNDPGIYWDWNRYFKLINTPPAANMITTANGNFFDGGGSGGNYADDERTIWTIAPVGATNVTVTFNTFNLENTWDYLYIYDGADLNASLIGYYTGTSNPGTITSSGGSLTFEFRSDCATTAAGWQAVYSSNSVPTTGDSLAPVSSISVANTWQTADFPVDFIDTEEAGGSGLEKSFYHVSYFDGTYNYANQNRGFLRDEFDGTFINPQWVQLTGTWNVNGGYMEQTDEVLSNTNIYASLEQDLSNIYMFEFSASIGGTGTNRRAGFHFYCDSAQLTNRGNSYFVWLRVDQQTVEIYKVTNDVFSLMQTDNISINADQFYNYKVFFDHVTGDVKVYMDNQVITQWTDPTPHPTGKYVSFRSGNANYKVGNIKVYRSRYSNSPATVTVGFCGTCDLLFENSSPSVFAGSVSTFSKDSADNLSATVTENINVDWTAPNALSYVNDISIFDEDTIPSNNLAGGNWNIAVDTNSGINRYYYCIGTTAGDSDVVNWYDNWFYTNFADTISLITNQWYYITAKSENGAGLQSIVTSSDGFIYVNLGTEDEKAPVVTVYPNPASEFLYIDGLGSDSKYKLEWIDLHGSVIDQQLILATNNNLVVNIPDGLSNSIYLLRLSSETETFHLRIEIIR
jgi:hypothetical protein